MEEERFAAAKLALARTVAESALTDAADFVKANRDDAQLMNHLQHFADLRVAVQGADPGAIERATSLLSAGLAADPVYTVYTERRRAEQVRKDEPSEEYGGKRSEARQ